MSRLFPRRSYLKWTAIGAIGLFGTILARRHGKESSSLATLHAEEVEQHVICKYMPDNQPSLNKLPGDLDEDGWGESWKDIPEIRIETVYSEGKPYDPRLGPGGEAYLRSRYDSKRIYILIDGVSRTSFNSKSGDYTTSLMVFDPNNNGTWWYDEKDFDLGSKAYDSKSTLWFGYVQPSSEIIEEVKYTWDMRKTPHSTVDAAENYGGAEHLVEQWAVPLKAIMENYSEGHLNKIPNSIGLKIKVFDNFENEMWYPASTLIHPKRSGVMIFDDAHPIPTIPRRLELASLGGALGIVLLTLKLIGRSPSPMEGK